MGLAVGDAVAVGVGVAVGDGLADVGDGLADVGDGDGELPDVMDADEVGPGKGGTTALPLAVPLGLVSAALDWVVGTEPEVAWLPDPLVVPGSPAWLEETVLGVLEFAKEPKSPVP